MSLDHYPFNIKRPLDRAFLEREKLVYETNIFYETFFKNLKRAVEEDILDHFKDYLVMKLASCNPKFCFKYSSRLKSRFEEDFSLG